MKTQLRILCVVLALAGCSSSPGNSAPKAQVMDKTTPTPPGDVETTSVHPPSPDADSPIAPGPDAPSVVTECTQSALGRSRCMIARLLRDVSQTYPLGGGGGISSVRAVATDTYSVSIAQEERVDVITYVLGLDERGEATIKQRTESTQSRGR